MKNIDISKLVSLSKSINQFIIGKNYDYLKRLRKTSIVDGLLFRLIYGQKNMSKDQAAILMNTFKDIKCKSDKINRSSYSDRDNQISIKLYEQIYDTIGKHIDENYLRRNTTEIFAVDCTQSHLSKILGDDGFKLNKNKLSVNGMTLGVYNITHNFPVALELVKHKNERKAFLDYIRNNDKYKNAIFLFDRGYIGPELFNKLDNGQMKFICRLREDSLLIPADTDDKIIDDKGHQRRIITYTINENKYYLITNLLDEKEYTHSILVQLYHKRWRIEEFFKSLKGTTNFDHMKEKNKEALMKNIYGQLIICRLRDLIKYVYGQDKCPGNQIFNNVTLTNGLYNNFIYNFFNGKLSRRKVRQFTTIHITFVTTNVGKHVPRLSSIPFSKWYIKGFYNKFIEKKKVSNAEKKAEKMAKRMKKKKILPPRMPPELRRKKITLPND